MDTTTLAPTTDPAIRTAIFNKVKNLDTRDPISLITEIMQVVETYDFLEAREKHAYTIQVAKLLDTVGTFIDNHGDSIIKNICKSSKGQLVNKPKKNKCSCLF